MAVRGVCLGGHLVPGRDVAGPAVNNQAGFELEAECIFSDMIFIFHPASYLSTFSCMQIHDRTWPSTQKDVLCGEHRSMYEVGTLYQVPSPVFGRSQAKDKLRPGR